MIALINTFDRLPCTVGTVLSMHRTVEAAEKSDREWQRSVKRGHGRDAYLPTLISAVRKSRGRWRKGDAVYTNNLV